MLAPIRALSLPALLALLAACGPPPAVRSAQGLLHQGDHAGAEAAADRGLQDHPDHPDLWRVKVQAAFGRGEAGRAVALYAGWQERRGGHDPALLRRLAMTTLWQGLRVPSDQVRTRTIQIVERLELEPLARDVAARIGDDSDLVAAAAAVALLRSEPGAGRVASQLLGSEDPAARALVVEGLGRKLGDRARDDLLAALGDPHPAVRRAAVQALVAASRRGRKRAVVLEGDLAARLVHLARTDPDGPVRTAALRALDRDARGPEIARLALEDAYPGARLAAIDILARAGETEPLRRVAASEDVAVAVHAAAALQDPVVLAEAVQRALAHPRPVMRQTGLNAVHRLADRAAAVQHASDGLQDRTWPVRLAAARALLALGERAPATEVLARALTRAGERERVHAAVDLVRVGDPRGADALAALGRSTDPDVREAVVRAHTLLHRGADGDRITGALVAALADESALVRILAAETLLMLVE